MSKRILYTLTDEQREFMDEHKRKHGGSFQSFMSTAIDDRIKELQGVRRFLEELKETRKQQALKSSTDNDSN